MNPTTTRTLPGITLDKIPGMGTGTEHAPTSTPVRRPRYPLVGHRAGLRRNDLTTLASALWVTALEGGTAHVTGPVTPSTVNTLARARRAGLGH